MTPQIAVQEKPQTSLEEELRSSINSIALIQVVDADSFARAGELKKNIVVMEKRIADYWSPLKDSAHKTWKGLVAKEKEMLDPLAKKKEEQVQIAKKWADEEERKRQEAERQAQEAARKQAEDEALAQAEALEKEGRKEEAEAVVAAPVPVPQVVVRSEVPKGYGGMTTKYYSATVTDIMALAKGVVAGTVPIQAIQGNDVFLNAQARAMKEALRYPGVKVNVR